MILDLLRKTFLQLPIKKTMSFRLEYTITLNAAFFLHKRGCTQLNKYILLVSPPYRRRTNTQNLTLPQLLVLRYLKGTMQLLHLLHPVSHLKGQVLILADMAASGVGDNLSETTCSLYICSSLFEKVRTVVCLKVLQVNLEVIVTLSEIFLLSQFNGLGQTRLRVESIPVCTIQIQMKSVTC